MSYVTSEEKKMKKLILLVLIGVLAFSAFAANENSSLTISTDITQQNRISFKYANDGTISGNKHTFSPDENSRDFKVVLWTNKASGSVPSVKLEAEPLINADNNRAYIKYTVLSATVENSAAAVVVSENLFNQESISGNAASEYSKAFTVTLDSDSRASALVGSYTGTLKVTVTAN